MKVTVQLLAGVGERAESDWQYLQALKDRGNEGALLVAKILAAEVPERVREELGLSLSGIDGMVSVLLLSLVRDGINEEVDDLEAEARGFIRGLQEYARGVGVQW